MTDLSEIYRGSEVATEIGKAYLDVDIIYNRSVGGNNPNVQAMIDFSNTNGWAIPSSLYLDKFNTFEEGIRSDEIIGSLDVLWFLFGDGSEDFRWLNFMNPAAHKITPFNNPIITEDGTAGNGIDAYLDLNWNPASDGVNYQLDSASLFVYQNTAASSGSYSMGVFASPSGAHIPTSLSGVAFRINSSSFINSSNYNSEEGFNQVNRTSSSNVNFYKEGVQQSSNTLSIDSLPNDNLFLLARNSGGVSLPTDAQISIAGAGADLSAKASEFNGHVQTLVA